MTLTHFASQQQAWALRYPSSFLLWNWDPIYFHFHFLSAATVINANMLINWFIFLYNRKNLSAIDCIVTNVFSSPVTNLHKIPLLCCYLQAFRLAHAVDQGFSKFWMVRANLAIQHWSKGHQRGEKINPICNHFNDQTASLQLTLLQ